MQKERFNITYEESPSGELIKRVPIRKNTFGAIRHILMDQIRQSGDICMEVSFRHRGTEVGYISPGELITFRDHIAQDAKRAKPVNTEKLFEHCLEPAVKASTEIVISDIPLVEFTSAA